MNVLRQILPGIALLLCLYDSGAMGSSGSNDSTTPPEMTDGILRLNTTGEEQELTFRSAVFPLVVQHEETTIQLSDTSGEDESGLDIVWLDFGESPVLHILLEYQEPLSAESIERAEKANCTIKASFYLKCQLTREVSHLSLSLPEKLQWGYGFSFFHSSLVLPRAVLPHYFSSRTQQRGSGLLIVYSEKELSAPSGSWEVPGFSFLKNNKPGFSWFGEMLSVSPIDAYHQQIAQAQPRLYQVLMFSTQAGGGGKDWSNWRSGKDDRQLPWEALGFSDEVEEALEKQWISGGLKSEIQRAAFAKLWSVNPETVEEWYSLRNKHYESRTRENSGIWRKTRSYSDSRKKRSPYHRSKSTESSRSRGNSATLDGQNFPSLPASINGLQQYMNVQPSGFEGMNQGADSDEETFEMEAEEDSVPVSAENDDPNAGNDSGPLDLSPFRPPSPTTSDEDTDVDLTDDETDATYDIERVPR